jgi:hypothetical protein
LTPAKNCPDLSQELQIVKLLQEGFTTRKKLHGFREKDNERARSLKLPAASCRESPKCKDFLIISVFAR